MFCIRSPELTHLITRSLYSDQRLPISPTSQPLETTIPLPWVWLFKILHKKATAHSISLSDLFHSSVPSDENASNTDTITSTPPTQPSSTASSHVQVSPSYQLLRGAFWDPAIWSGSWDRISKSSASLQKIFTAIHNYFSSLFFYLSQFLEYGLPWCLSSKESACNTGDVGSVPGLGRSPGKGNGNPTPVFLPGKFHGQSSLAGYSAWSLNCLTWLSN